MAASQTLRGVHMMPKEGDIAPPFELQDQDGAVRSILEWAGKWLLIYFYPKDDTPGCTKEACTFQSRLPDFSGAGYSVVGISIDGVESHEKFAQKYKLTFPLLSDEQKEVVGAYGVWGKKTMAGKEYMGVNRASFLVDPHGHIAKVYSKVDPEVHAQEVLTDLEALTRGWPF